MCRITGRLKKIIYRNLENYFSVVALEDVETDNEFIATGSLPEIVEGTVIVIKGSWITHQRFGKQLKIDSYDIERPVSIRD